MTEQSEQGGAALIITILALVLVPAAYVWGHPHPLGRRAWVAAEIRAASAEQGHMPRPA